MFLLAREMSTVLLNCEFVVIGHEVHALGCVLSLAKTAQPNVMTFIVLLHWHADVLHLEWSYLVYEDGFAVRTLCEGLAAGLSKCHRIEI